MFIVWRAAVRTSLSSSKVTTHSASKCQKIVSKKFIQRGQRLWQNWPTIPDVGVRSGALDCPMPSISSDET